MDGFPGMPRPMDPAVPQIERYGKTGGLLGSFAGRSEYLITALTLVAVVTVFATLSPSFLTLGNFLDIARVVSIIGIMAMGMTLVMLIGGIDLSVGSVLALAGAVAASLVAGSRGFVGDLRGGKIVPKMAGVLRVDKV